MPPTYEMPKHHNCSAGREPSYAVQTELWNVPGWGNAAMQKKHFQCKKHVVTVVTTVTAVHLKNLWSCELQLIDLQDPSHNSFSSACLVVF